MTLFAPKVLLDLFSKQIELTERLMLSLVVLHVRAKIDFEKVTKVGYVISRPSRHLCEPSIELVKAIYSDHVIYIAELLKVLPKRMHSLCQISALLLYLQSCLDNLLMKHLVAICKVVHSRAENHSILVHFDADISFCRNQLYN